MTPLGQRIRNTFGLHAGWLALLSAIALTLIGIAAIDTAGADGARFAAAQLRWLGIGMVVVAVCVLPHPRTILASIGPLMLVTLALLIFVIVPFVPRWIVEPRNGARSWINFYFMSFQPSELAKIVFVLALARYLRYRENYRTLRGLLVPFLMMFIPVGLILKEPDLGSAMLFAPALFAVLVVAGAKISHLSTLLALAVLAIAINVLAIYHLPDSMQLLKRHQRDRIKALISQAQDDKRYVKDIGYQQDKARTLVGSGMLVGYGAERAPTILRFNHLPESHNDMIFAVIVNRWGLMGGLVTIGLYLLLLLSFILVAIRSKDPFARLAIVGFAGILFSQATINIGMTIGVLPITGITLPFMSYGGSSLLACYAVIGLVINFASQRPSLVTRPSFEFDNADAIFQ